MGKGAFQECDQVAAVKPFCKYAGHARSLRDVPSVVAAAFSAATSGRPGAAYVGLPSNVLLERAAPHGGVEAVLRPLAVMQPVVGVAASAGSVASAAALLRSASKPLIVVGKGAAMSAGAEDQVGKRLTVPVLTYSLFRSLLDSAGSNAGKSLWAARARHCHGERAAAR